MTADGRWAIEPGALIKRTAVHRAYGGVQQGGISPSRTTPNILLFSDPASARKHGYFEDRWEGDLFLYCGSGQIGDQSLRRYNRSLNDHERDHRKLRLFQGTRGTVRYVGAFTLDPDRPWVWETAADRHGNGRRVIVFRLAPDHVGRVDTPDARAATFAPRGSMPTRSISTAVRNEVSSRPTRAQRGAIVEAVLAGSTTRAAARRCGVSHSSARWTISEAAWSEVRRLNGWGEAMTLERILRLTRSPYSNPASHESQARPPELGGLWDQRESQLMSMAADLHSTLTELTSLLRRYEGPRLKRKSQSGS